jgi:hypothetical protein
VLAVALAGTLSGGADAAVNPAVNIHAKTTICGKDQHIVTIERVDIRNNNFLGEPMCLTNFYYKADFQITSSGLHDPWAAYPNAYVGCEQFAPCTPESPMPIQVSNIRQAYSSWHYHPGGPWTGNAAYDIWFAPKKQTNAPVDHGAEVMIWLNQNNVGAPSGIPVFIDGTWWDFTWWEANHDGRTWNYVRFWRTSPTLRVTNLNLKTFFAYAESQGLLSSKWWLTAVESGYELWNGGVGMHTLWYSVLVTPWHAAKPPPPAPKPKPKPKPKPTTTLPAAPKPTPLSTTSPPTAAPAATGTSAPPASAPPASIPANSPSGSPTPTATSS